MNRSVALGLALYLVAVAAPAGAQDFVLLGFGDSVTRGDGCPVDCSGVFDEAGLGGYVGRLDSRLGAGYRVVNHGVGGETTAEGLSRINSVLNGGDVVMLMEGTNDISRGISVETIRANLGAMGDRATAKGVDTLYASVIRRIRQPGHGPTSDLADEVRSLAASKERAFANPYGPLCPNDFCFDQHYYQPDQKIGHVDASGYDIMTTLFEAVITADSTPPQPAPTSPSGTIADEQPSYVWPHLSAARWYQLQVDDASGNRVVDEMVDASTACAGGTCTATPNRVLLEGDHEWRVRGRSLIGYGAWSPWLDFEVAFTLPGEVVLVAPSGEFFDPSPIVFEYEWTTASDTDEYELRVERGSELILNEFLAAADCSGGRCKTTPATALSGGAYSWRVRGLNLAGKGLWSGVLEIDVYNAAPSPPILLSPEAETYVHNPTYRWVDLGGVTDYHFELEDAAGDVLLANTYSAAGCTDGVCSRTPGLTLGAGDYRWRIQATNPLGTGGWTGRRAFTVHDCTPPVNRSVPAGTISDSASFTTCGQLSVPAGVRVSPTGDATFHAGDRVVLEDGLKVDAGGRVTVRVDPAD